MLIGRESEFGLLCEGASRHPSVVVVEGEAGVGKSRLIREMARAAQGQGQPVLVGNCRPLREPFPLGPVIEALGGAETRRLNTALSPLIGVLRPLLPELSDYLPHHPGKLDDPRAERHRVFRALHSFFEALGPAVCVLEDLHWAEEGTLEFLSFLISDPPTTLALVVSYRGEELDPSSPLLALTSRVSTKLSAATIKLSALSPEEVRDLACAALGKEEISSEFARWLHERTDGIPFAVEEVLGVLQEHDELDAFDHGETTRVVSKLEVPPAVRQSVLVRIADLSEDAKLVTRAAAVLGNPVSQELMGAAANLPSSRGERGLIEALGARLLEEDEAGRYCFRHALAAQAVYEEIPGPTRRRLHLSAAQALESGPKPLAQAQIAYHFKLAGRTAQWVGWAEAAANTAASVGDDCGAVKLLEDALSAPRVPRAARVRMAFTLGRASLYSVSPQLAISIIERTLEEPMAVGMRGELRLFLAGLLCHAGDGSEWPEHMRRAVEELRRRPERAIHAMVNLALPDVREGHLEEHLGWLGAAVRASSRCDDPVAGVTIQMQRAQILLSVGDHEGWLLASEVPREASSVRAKLELLRGYQSLSLAALGLGYHRRAEFFHVEAQRIHAGLNHEWWSPGLEAARASIDWALGRREGLEARLRELGERTAGVPGLFRGSQLVLASLLLSRGELDEARQILTSAYDEARVAGAIPAIIAASAKLAGLHLAVGNADAARELAILGLEAVRRKGIWTWASQVAPVAVDALLAHGARQEAQRLARDFSAGLRGRDAPAARAASAWCRGAIAESDGRDDAASRWFSRAERIWHESPAPYEAAQARVRRARCLLRKDDKRGGELLLGALEAYDALGASWDAGRVLAELRAQRVALPYPWRGGRRSYGNGLSPREAEVARLAGAGWSNREIGEALFLSHRTIEDHVSSVLRKLGVESRRALGSRPDGGSEEQNPVAPRIANRQPCS